MKRRMKAALALLAGVASATALAPATAQTPFIGDIITVPYTFCPVGYYEANGSLVAISENDTLYALYGTTYGGDGVTTFGLPDYRGRFGQSQFQGPGLSNYVIGQLGGNESVTLTTQNMPTHTHTALLKAHPYLGNSASPVNNFPAESSAAAYHTVEGANFFNAATVEVSTAGGSQPVAIQSPFLALRNCVAAFGIFPSQN